MTKKNLALFIEQNTLRLDASGRGGGIEIDTGEFFGEDTKMTAYQNYLGGGMLGRICSDANFEPESEKQELFDELEIELKKYFHDLTNHEDDEWEEQSFKQNQTMPVSGY